ncbi:MAG: ExeA family protein [Planctomycetota bacterium]|jgi:type II secretory pathway predicted ATPase ExeA
MYAAHFGLREAPFNNTPDPRFFFATPDHEEALASLIYTVNELKGYVLLTVEVGAGKTLVSRMMLRHFGDRISSAVISNTALSADDLLAAVCAEFDQAPTGAGTRFQLVKALQDHLLAEQNLPHDAFEQLRMIGNLEADDAKLLQVIIVGQPELRQRFQAPHMRQLRQRIFRSFHLPALSSELCAAYIRHRLAVAAVGSGDRAARSDQPGSSEIFDGGAITVVHEYSQGLPRLVNTACDNAMLSAYAADRRKIDTAFMQDVIDLLTAQHVTRPKARWKTLDRGAATSEPPAAPAGVAAGGPPSAATPDLERRLTRLESRLTEIADRIGRLALRPPTSNPSANLAPSPGAAQSSTVRPPLVLATSDDEPTPMVAMSPIGNPDTGRMSLSTRPLPLRQDLALDESQRHLQRLVDRSRTSLDRLQALATRTAQPISDAGCSADSAECEDSASDPSRACIVAGDAQPPGPAPCPAINLAREVDALADFAAGSASYL